MGQLRMLAVSVVVLAVSAAGALAADVPKSPPMSLPPPAYERPLPQSSFFSGWYLRGDLGYRWGQNSGSNPAAGYPATVSEKMGNGIAAGFGAGIKSDWLRTDVTVDFGAPLKYEATTVTPNDTTAKITAISALFNGYLDLGTWYHMSPYIGAGAGVAHMRTHDYVSTVAPPFTSDTSHNQWNFAWAGMAGVAYAISRNVMVDVGYRYINFGNVSTGSDSFGSNTLKNIAAHEVRVGLRWSFDDLPMAR